MQYGTRWVHRILEMYVIKVARLARNESDIDMIIEAIQEYGD
jgi:hypothetical protein